MCDPPGLAQKVTLDERAMSMNQQSFARSSIVHLSPVHTFHPLSTAQAHILIVGESMVGLAGSLVLKIE